LNVSYRLTGVENGVGIYVVSINGKEFEYRSPVGGIEIFENRRRTIVRLRVASEDSRGTYVGGDIDYYYHVGDKGQITYLGSLKESWYEDEDFIRAAMSGFKPVIVP